MTEQEQNLVNSLAFIRELELKASPIKGRFDVDHLKKIHHHLFQDLPKHDVYGYEPGLFRNPMAEGNSDHQKRRPLGIRLDDPHPPSSFICYSDMGNRAVSTLKNELNSNSIEQLKTLKPAEFTQKIGELYAQVDFVHPFADGNSRTLRTFFSQMAKEAGYHIDWERFNKNPASKAVLYLARDLSVNEISVPYIRSPYNRRDVQANMMTFSGNRKLPDLLQDAIQPLPARAFSNLPEKEALALHPALKGAYTLKNQSGLEAQKLFPGNSEKQKEHVKQAVINIYNRLKGGETISPPQKVIKKETKNVPKNKDPGRD